MKKFMKATIVAVSAGAVIALALTTPSVPTTSQPNQPHMYWLCVPGVCIDNHQSGVTE